MVTQYFVCYGYSAAQLQENVNKAIANGWQPFGGVSVAISVKWLSGEYRVVAEEVRELFSQAVVRMTEAGVVAGADAPPVEQKMEYSVILRSVGPNKINVIKAIREVTSLGLAEAKDLVDAAPKPIKEGASREEAESIRMKLAQAGATVEVK